MKHKINRAKTASAVALTVTLSGCATGPSFVGVEPPPEGFGQVYFYRSWQLTGGAASMKVIADGVQTETTLPNGSWERLPLKPGRHGLGLRDYLNTFSCGGVEVEVEAGKTIFVSVDFTTITPIGTQAYLVCKMELRQELTAIRDIAGMRRSK